MADLIHLHSGDVLVTTLPGGVGPEALSKLTEAWRALVPDVKLVIVAGEQSVLAVLHEAKLTPEEHDLLGSTEPLFRLRDTLTVDGPLFRLRDTLTVDGR